MDFCSLQVRNGQANDVNREELASAGVNTRTLHKHHITHAMHNDNLSIMGQFKAQNLHSGPGYFSVAWSDLYDLFNLDVLDISLIRCLWCGSEAQATRGGRDREARGREIGSVGEE